MPRIKSTWTITWVETGKSDAVLLSAGDWMVAEPTLPQQHMIQDADFLEADYKTFWDRAGIAYELTFSKIYENYTPESSRNFLLSHSVQLASIRHGSVIISVSGGARYELHNAAIESLNPDMGIDLMKLGRLAFTYRVRGGRLSKLNDNAVTQVTDTCSGWLTECGAGIL